MQDAETEEMIFIDTANKKIRTNFAKRREEEVRKIKKLFPASGVDLINITTGDDYVKPLINFFKNRRKRR